MDPRALSFDTLRCSNWSCRFEFRRTGEQSSNKCPACQLVERRKLAGSKREPMPQGICDVCFINLYGDPANPKPADGAMPCNCRGCPFEDQSKQIPFTLADLTTIAEAATDDDGEEAA